MHEKCAIWMTVVLLAFATANPLAGAERVRRDVPFVPTPQEVVDRMLEMANVTENDIVYDLGCGDGRIVITAVKEFGASGVGVDIDPQRIKESRENARVAGVTDQVRFMNKDLFQVDLSEATVVTLYLLPSVNLKLRPKLLEELRPGTRVVSHAFDMGDWEPDATSRVDGRTIYFWVIPEKVSGRWNCVLETPEGPQQAALQLTQRYQMVSGTAQVGGRTIPLKNGKLRGDELTFTLDDPLRGGVPVRYTCRVDGNDMRGTAQPLAARARSMNWSGTR